MLQKLEADQAAIKAQINAYASTRQAFENLLRKCGQEIDAGPFWWLAPYRRSRSNWESIITAQAPMSESVVIEVATDPGDTQFGRLAMAISQAAISVRVRPTDNPGLERKAQLPPLEAIRRQSSGLEEKGLNELINDLGDVVPLIIASLSKND